MKRPPTPSFRWAVLPGPFRGACWRISSLLMIAACLHAPANAADPTTERPARPDRHPELRRLSRTEDVWIDVRRKRVLVGGTIAVATGPIEFFACPEGTKEHESIVAVRSSARLVHAALLAIGLEPGKPVSFDPEYVAASGPVVRITMQWRDETGRELQIPAQAWVRDTRSGAAMKEEWVFAGSEFWTDPADGREYYQADGGDFICLSNFPTALLDLPIESSQSNEALLFEAFEGRIPPRGTDVEMVLSGPAPPVDGGSPKTK